MNDNSPCLHCRQCGEPMASSPMEGLCPACLRLLKPESQTNSGGGHVQGDAKESLTKEAAASQVREPERGLIAPEARNPKRSLAAMGGAFCVLFFVSVMVWWLLDPDLLDDRYAASSLRKERFDTYIRPLGFAAVIAATGLGLFAVRNIRKSSLRLGGLGLAVFDCLVLPLLGINFLILVVWTFADKVLASWRGLGGSMFRNFGEVAIWAVLIGVSIALMDYWIIRRVWRRTNRNLISPQPTPAESARTRVKQRRVAIAIGLGSIVVVPLALIVSEINWKGRFGFPVQGRDVHYRIFEANATLLDPLVPAASREDGFNRAPRAHEVAGTRSKVQTAELDENALEILYANASTNSGFLADKRLTGNEIWRERGEAWNYSGRFGSGSGRGGLRLTDKKYVTQLGARYQINHDFPGASSPVNVEISYQGEAPQPDCARAFMVPYQRDGRDVYLVIAFEVK